MKAVRAILDYVPSATPNELIADWLMTVEYEGGEVEQRLDSRPRLLDRAKRLGLKVEYTERARKQAWAEFRRRYGR